MAEVLEREEKGTFVCFRVDGKWLADFARTRLEEGAPDRALTLLVDSLHGLTHEQAIAILKGEADLYGDSGDKEGIGIKDLSKTGRLAKRMQKILDRMYGTVFAQGDVCYKPYATVVGWDREDWHFAMKFQGNSKILDATGDANRRSILSNTMPTYVKYRSLYYANDPLNDMLITVGSSKLDAVDILCERVERPPFWYKIPVNKTEQFMRELHEKGISLRARGAAPLDMGYTKDREVGEKMAESLEDALNDAEAASYTPRPETPEDVAEKSKKREEAVAEARRLIAEMPQAIQDAKDVGEIRELERAYQGAMDALNRFSMPDDVYDAQAQQYLEMETKREQMVGHLVRLQAEEHGGFIDLPLTVDGVPYGPKPFIKVPKNPFIHWALHGFSFEAYGKEAPAWVCKAGTGWKMMNDNPYHTDWMLGAGIPLSETYNHAYKDEEKSLGEIVRDCSFNMRVQLIEEWTGVKFAFLAKSDDTWFGGDIVHPEPNEACEPGSIAIVPNAGPQYQLAMETACKKKDGRAGVLICETGGKVAHLAIVGREMKCMVLMVPNALTMYKPGMRIFINIPEGKITRHL